MTSFFLDLLDRSVVASWLVFAVLLLRLLLKKAPKWIHCFLWLMIGLRLIFPFSVESMLSIIPNDEPVSSVLLETSLPQADPTESGGVFNITTEGSPQNSAGQQGDKGDEDMRSRVISAATVLWAVGGCAMLLYAGYSYLRLRRRVKVSMRMQERVYLCDSIQTPFILGVFRPRIYLPSELLEGRTAEYALAHERAHLKRLDHCWKPLGYLLLCVHWFNPVIWIAYVGLCRDIELACDEHVVKNMGTEEKVAYTRALVQCSVSRKMISACPLAFGEVHVKERIQNVLHYKKPAIWIILIALVICVCVAIGFLTNPNSEESLPDSSSTEENSHETGTESVVSEVPKDTDGGTQDGKIPFGFQSIAVTFSDVEFSDAVKYVGCVRNTCNEMEIALFTTHAQLNDCIAYLRSAQTSFYAEIFGVGSVLEDYDEAFFEENALVIAFSRESSGGNINYLLDVAKMENTMLITMQKGVGQDDSYKELFNCICVPKSAVKGIERFDVSMTYFTEYAVFPMENQTSLLDDENCSQLKTYFEAESTDGVFLVSVDSREELNALLAKDGMETLAECFAVYDEAFFEKNILYLLCSEQNASGDWLHVSNDSYIRSHFSSFASTEQNEITIFHLLIDREQNTSQNESGLPLLVSFGISRYDVSALNDAMIEFVSRHG